MSLQELEKKHFIVYYDEQCVGGPKAELKIGDPRELFTEDMGWEPNDIRRFGYMDVDAVVTPWSPTFVVKVWRVK